MTDGRLSNEELEQAKRRIQSLTCTPIDGEWIERLLTHIATLQREVEEMREALSKAIVNLEMASVNSYAFEGDDDPDYISAKNAWESDLAYFRAALKALPPQEDEG